MKSRFYIVFMAMLIAFSGNVFSQKESRLFNFPSIHGDKIVFSYGGDLYTVNSNGGIARKLTSHKGYEMFPRFSPDGSTIAFTGQYDGNTEVFTIPAEGGNPKRLTFTATLDRDDLGDRMGPNNIVMGWTPDGKYITFRSRRYSFNSFTGQLFNVPAEGGICTEIPLKNGGFCSWSRDGKYLAYNHIFREFRTWKRYKGGMADDIRIFNTDTQKSEKITNDKAQDIIPMWSPKGNELFFLSERDNRMNLYSYDLNSKDLLQITHFKDFDIKFPSIGKDYLVFSNGGYIYKMNIETKEYSKVEITIANDNIYSRPVIKDLKDDISEISIAPGGERIAVVARGDVFSVPAKEGITYNLSKSCMYNDRNINWSPDGKYIAYVSDKSGEFQIYLHTVNSTEEDIQLTKDYKTYIFSLEWSPDSKYLLWNDKKHRLFITNIESKETILADKSDESPIRSFNWAPDSKWITYIKPNNNPNNVFSDIILYNAATKEKYTISDNWFDKSAPNFSNDGKFLVFASSRTFNPTYSWTEWNHSYSNMEKIYLMALDKDTPSPFALKNDMVKADKGDVSKDNSKKKDKKNSKKEEKNKDTGVNVKIDFEGITDRIIEVPVIAASYYGIHMINNKLYYKRWGKDRGDFVYDLKNKKETALGTSILFAPGYKKALAVDGKKMQIIDIPSSKVSIDKPIDLSGLRKEVDYHKEWMQIYNESWRQMRDFFYADNMHGVDWNAMYDKYKVLIPYVTHRTDLTLILGELIGELSVGHAYSANGEIPKPARIKTGLLGAKFVKDNSGYFKITEILKGTNWRDDTRSPLKDVGVNINTGDYIIAIDGQSLKDIDNIYECLVGKAEQAVELTVNSKGNYKGSRKVLVRPLADESALYYYNWVQNNIDKVNKATDGKVGYIHIPDMGVEGLNEFVKHFYPQLTKKALIIDDRGNGGGNVSPMIIERLKRTADYYTMNRNQKKGNTSPYTAFLGPKVLLVDQYSASDGDLFPYRFRKNNLGTIIGKRTWGGVVGYAGYIPVVDGGHIVTPSHAPFSDEGKFIIEGYGVDPDIEIDNDPYKEYMGEDEQLNKAIEVILEKLKTESKEIPAIPAFPDKSAK